MPRCGHPPDLGALAPRLREGRVEGRRAGAASSARSPPRRTTEENLIVHRGERCFVILNLYPYTNGHLMVAPFEHVAGLEDLPAETTAEMMALAQRAIAVLKESLRAARLQRRLQPGPGRGRRGRAPHPHARRPALGRRHQLHAGAGRHPGDAADARADATRRWGQVLPDGGSAGRDLQGLRHPRPLRLGDGRRDRLPRRPGVRARARRRARQGDRASSASRSAATCGSRRRRWPGGCARAWSPRAAP